MEHSRLYKKSILAVALALASQHAMAAGFQLNAQSATGLGRAFAGDAVIADNASVMSKNPAAMALFKSSQFSTGLNVINTSIDIKDVQHTNAINQTSSVEDAHNGEGTLVPNIYYVHRLNDTWAFGAGVYSNFGTKNDFPENWGGQAAVSPTAKQFGGITEIQSIDYALTASYRLNEHLSFGAGLDVIHGQGKLYRGTGSDADANGVNINANGTGFGWNTGVVYEVDKNTRFGLDYHYSPEIKAKGMVEYNGSSYDNVKLPLPSFAEFSGYHRFEDSKFALHYSIQWIDWSVFKSLDIENYAGSTTPLKEYQWKDGWHYSIGGTYYLNKAWTLRAGYMYDTAAQDQLTSISVPDSDRQWFTTGLSYHFSKHHTIDFGIAYIMGKDTNVEESNYLGNTRIGTVTAVTKADAVETGIQYSYSF